MRTSKMTAPTGNDTINADVSEDDLTMIFADGTEENWDLIFDPEGDGETDPLDFSIELSFTSNGITVDGKDGRDVIMEMIDETPTEDVIVIVDTGI